MFNSIITEHVVDKLDISSHYNNEKLKKKKPKAQDTKQGAKLVQLYKQILPVQLLIHCFHFL